MWQITSDRFRQRLNQLFDYRLSLTAATRYANERNGFSAWEEERRNYFIYFQINVKELSRRDQQVSGAQSKKRLRL